MARRFLAFFLIILVVFLVVFLVKNKSVDYQSDSKIQIATSFYPIYFLSSQIAGDKMNVFNITLPGTEPHDYELTSGDIIKIKNSRVLFLSGNLESWSDKIKENIKGEDVEVILLSEGLMVNKDPHVWLSPTLFKMEAKKVLEEFFKIDPENADYYRSNWRNLDDKLSDLNGKYKEGLISCESRSFVTSHAAFSYLSRDYNLTQVAISGINPDEEPSFSRLAQLTDFVRKNNVKYIFFESLVSPKLAETLANEVGAKTLVLDPIEGISNENLSKGENYLTLMEANLQNLRVALNCK